LIRELSSLEGERGRLLKWGHKSRILTQPVPKDVGGEYLIVVFVDDISTAQYAAPAHVSARVRLPERPAANAALEDRKSIDGEVVGVVIRLLLNVYPK
jgi:hypothetical protein